MGGDPNETAYLDANVILRLVVGDGGDHPARARRLLASNVRFVLTGVVAAEIVHVLGALYKRERTFIVEVLRRMLALPNVTTLADEPLEEATDLYEAHPIDFADAYLAALGERTGKPIASFDTDFDRIPTVKRLAP